MRSIKEEFYYQMLGLMASYTSSEADEFLEKKGVKAAADLLKLDPYIDNLRMLINKHFLKNAQISEEDISTNIPYSRELEISDDFYFESGNSDDPLYHSRVVELVQEFHNDFVMKHKYQGDKKFASFFVENRKFINLEREEFLFELTFVNVLFERIGAKLHLSLHKSKGYGKILDPRPELWNEFKSAYEDVFEFDVDEIKNKYTHIDKASYEALGHHVDKAVGDSFNLTLNTNQKILFIPATIDGKPINTVSSLYSSSSQETTKAVVFLGNVEQLQKFASNNPNISLLYIFGEIKQIDDESFGSSSKVFNRTSDAIYLKTVNNNYYALLKITDNRLEELEINKECLVVASRAFSYSAVRKINLNNVKYISSRAFYNSLLESIDLSNVVCVNDSAFASSKNLKKIIFGNNLKEIPFFCFMDCESLETLYFPINIKDIVGDAFSGCKSLKNLYFANADIWVSPNSFPKDVTNLKIYGNENFKSRHYEYSDTFESYPHEFVLCDVENLDEEDVYSSNDADSNTANNTDEDFYVKNILYYTDDSCNMAYISYKEDSVGYKLEKFVAREEYNGYPMGYISYIFNEENLPLKYLHFKNNVEFLDECFENAPNLETVIVENGEITKIKSDVFKNSEKLKTVVDGVEYIKINDNPYYICSGYKNGSNKNITLHPDCVIVQNYAFYNTDIRGINFSNVKYIGDYVLDYCKNLQTIIMNDTTLTLGESSFARDCPNVRILKLSNSLKKLEGILISDNEMLENLEMPENLESVWSIVVNCSGLKEVKFQPKCKKYGWFVFSECKNLKKVYIPKGSDCDNVSFKDIEVIEY